MVREKKLTYAEWTRRFYKNKSLLEFSKGEYSLDDQGKKVFISFLKKENFPYFEGDLRQITIYTKKGVISLKISSKFVKQLEQQLEQYHLLA